MKLAVVGAFPFPLAQGSQLFARDQARALGAAGARVTLFCYGHGDGPDPPDLEVVRVSRALSPAALRAGPSPGKPLGDFALAARLAAACRRRRFDAVLAHNVEGALVAQAARPLGGAPVVYVAHTLLAHELASYAPAALAPPLDALGRRLDALAAGRSDAVLALCRAAAAALAPHARGPVEVVPPGLTPAPPPDPAAIDAACARHGLSRGGFALYTGNLDGYQDLPELAEAARLRPGTSVVVATHAEPRALPPLRVVHVYDAEEQRALLHAAGCAVLPRRRPGGFPIKLLNYMEAGRAVVARETLADGLAHDRSAWLLPPGARAAALADAMATLLADPERAARLGRGAREVLEKHHAWPALAERTLALVRRVASANAVSRLST